MGYKLMFYPSNGGRGTRWDDKNYPTKQSAVNAAQKANQEQKRFEKKYPNQSEGHISTVSTGGNREKTSYGYGLRIPRSSLGRVRFGFRI